MRVYGLCEYMDRPVGLDMEAPRFSWSLEDAGQGTAQESWRIVVERCGKNSETVWDSGEVRDRRCGNIAYAGAALETACTYRWRVRLGLGGGEYLESEDYFFSTGLMREDREWRAPWVGGHHLGHSCYWYRCALRFEKPVASASAFVLSGCYYVLTVNGQRADDTLLNNTTSDYAKTLYYATYDLTGKVNREGENVLGMSVGYGWENLRLSEDGIGWEENSFSVRVYVRYEDGTAQWFDTGLQDWHYLLDGPILDNSLYNGEIYDAREEIAGFDEPGFAMDDRWHAVVEHESPGGRIKSQYLEPMRIVQELRAKEIYALPDGSVTVDFGQNFSGWLRLKVSGPAGTKITLQYAELIYEDHSVNTISLRNAKARDVYILKGEGEEIYEPRFTFHGFQYVQIFDLPEEADRERLVGCVVRSDTKRVGCFKSSDPLLDQIYSNIVWTEMCNQHGVPTDCPQRDERLGWLNDMTVRNECAIYNFRLPQLYEKWEQDIRDTQGRSTGAITDTAPFRRYGNRPADPVSSSFLLVAWNIYQHYGDRKILEENYEPVKRWASFLLRNSDEKIVRYSQMGDWAGPIGGTDQSSSGGGAISAITPTVLMATGFLYYDCLLISRMAAALGKTLESVQWEALAAEVKDAFNRRFFHEEEGYYASNSQASNAFPLYLGLVPEGYEKTVLRHMTEDIRAHGKHLTTGNLCSRYIMEVLLRSGEEDLAYDIFSSREYPGWGYMVANGATTIWERWEKVVGDGVQAEMASYNHPMNGAAGVCFSKHLAGILVNEAYPGFERFTIFPVVPKKLRSASFRYESVRGCIESGWEQTEEGLRMRIVVPSGTRADVYVPAGAAAAQILLNGREFSPEAEKETAREERAWESRMPQISGEEQRRARRLTLEGGSYEILRLDRAERKEEV